VIRKSLQIPVKTRLSAIQYKNSTQEGKMKKLLVLLTMVITPTASHGEIINLTGAVNGVNNPVSVFLTAGMYESTIINPSIDPQASFTAWSFSSNPVSGWRTQYIVDLDNGTRLGLGGEGLNATSPAEAFAQTTDLTFQFTVPTDQLIKFSVADTTVVDNLGGLSLSIDEIVPTVPTLSEWGTIVLMLGLAGAAFVRVRQMQFSA